MKVLTRKFYCSSGGKPVLASPKNIRESGRVWCQEEEEEEEKKALRNSIQSPPPPSPPPPPSSSKRDDGPPIRGIQKKRGGKKGEVGAES